MQDKAPGHLFSQRRVVPGAGLEETLHIARRQGNHNELWPWQSSSGSFDRSSDSSEARTPTASTTGMGTFSNADGVMEDEEPPTSYLGGYGAAKTLPGTLDTSEGYEQRQNPRDFFSVGRVFLILGDETSGNLSLPNRGVTAQRPAIPPKRRLVVVRKGIDICEAVIIHTYYEQGTAKSGVTKSDHAIIYTGNIPPNLLPGEQPKGGEAAIRPHAIRVQPDSLIEKLSPSSRVNFGEAYHIKHSVPVRSFGMVDKTCLSHLICQWRDVVEGRPGGKTVDRTLLASDVDKRKAYSGQGKGPIGYTPTPWLWSTTFGWYFVDTVNEAYVLPSGQRIPLTEGRGTRHLTGNPDPHKFKSWSQYEKERPTPSQDPGAYHTLDAKVGYTSSWGTPSGNMCDRGSRTSANHLESLPQATSRMEISSENRSLTGNEQAEHNYVETIDPRTKVRVVVKSGPDITTDPALIEAGIIAHKEIRGTDPETEALYPTFRKRNRPSQFFRLGRVFMVLWAEPAGDVRSGSSVVSSHIETLIPGKYGEKLFSKVRRFVVIRESAGYCSALAVMSYGNRGVVRAEAKLSEHGIVYIGKQPPNVTPQELPQRGETGMCPMPVRIDPDSPAEKLSPMARINYGKVYTVEHNVKVRPIGQVSKSSVQALIYQFKFVWASSFGVSGRTDPGSKREVGVQTEYSPGESDDSYGFDQALAIDKHRIQADGVDPVKANTKRTQLEGIDEDDD